MLESLLLIIKPYLNQYGSWAVSGEILSEDFGLPTPGETLLIAGSLLASEGGMHVVPLLLTAWLGAVVGDNIGYTVGRFGGRGLIVRYGQSVHITQKLLGRAEVFLWC